MSSEFGCPVEFALNVLGGKWKTVLLAHLKSGPKRYRDLRNLVPKLSDKMLTQRIHELELGGLIEKDAASAYVMTDRGRSLSPVLQALFDWGEEHRDS